MANHTLRDQFTEKPQLLVRERLISLGESIAITLYLPQGMEKGLLQVYPRFLENSGLQPVDAVPDSLAAWIGTCESRSISFETDAAGFAELSYQPDLTGNFLIRWQTDGGDLFRYFSVITPDFTVATFSTFFEADPQPSFHSFGIPVDYKLPAAQFAADDPLCQKLARYHREFGDLVVMNCPDSPEIGVDERAGVIGSAIETAKHFIPDENDFRSIRIDMQHFIDYGYTQSLKKLGVVDHCGLWEANALYWLGMPEFFYYASDNDCRKTSQAEKGSILTHQWDFCPGFHFPGPVTWHYRTAHGDWEKTEHCLRQALQEAENCAAMSGHPAFITPLYEGVTPNQGFEEPNDPHYLDGRLEQFILRFQKFYACQAVRDFKLVFSRSIDIADYYLRHWAVTPRTLFSTLSDHIDYDNWWQCIWTNERIPAARARLPWLTRPSSVMAHREKTTFGKFFDTGIPLKDSLSYEFLIVEDQKRSLRFERECPHPLWWFDYTDPAPFYSKGTKVYRVAPDADIVKRITRENGEVIVSLSITSPCEIDDYTITVWDVPASVYQNNEVRFEGARECLVAWNTAREYHLVIRFDLKKECSIRISWPDNRTAGAQASTGKSGQT
jgi:hypothetical protein